MLIVMGVLVGTGQLRRRNVGAQRPLDCVGVDFFYSG
jgi:hypothetical protein